MVVALFLSATILISCDDSKNRLLSIDDDKDIPTMSVDSLRIHYTEKGLLRMDLTAPLMQRFMLAEEPYNEFKKGIHIYFYTPTRELESEIVADYAINKEKPQESWKACGNVVITNYTKQQTLYTDTLYWDRQQQTIYTDAPVKIITPDSEILGTQGMTSDERFSDYEIRTVRNSHVFVNDENANDSTDTQTSINLTTPFSTPPTQQIQEEKTEMLSKSKRIKDGGARKTDFKKEKQSIEEFQKQ